MSSSPSGREADVVVRNASIYTLDAAAPRAEALAIRDGRILAVGNLADVWNLIGDGTSVLDASGRMIMPGLVDAHSHVGFGGQQTAWELVLSPGHGDRGAYREPGPGHGTG